MNEWITDRRPREDDGPMIYGPDGKVCHYTWIDSGNPWKPIPKCEPYVKPKRYAIRCYGDFGLVGPAGFWCVYDTVAEKEVTCFMPLEAAERIAATYEEVMP